MKRLRFSEVFPDELVSWSLRAPVCAIPSLVWAYSLGHRRPAEIAGMLTGVAFWIGIMAWFCTWWARQKFETSDLVKALKTAVLIKCGLVVVGLGLKWLAGFFHDKGDGLSFISVVFLMDGGLGAGAIILAGNLKDLVQAGALFGSHSFGWTALVSLIQGALIVAALGVIALAIHAITPTQPIRKFSPARSSG